MNLINISQQQNNKINELTNIIQQQNKKIDELNDKIEKQNEKINKLEKMENNIIIGDNDENHFIDSLIINKNSNYILILTSGYKKEKGNLKQNYFSENL